MNTGVRMRRTAFWLLLSALPVLGIGGPAPAEPAAGAVPATSEGSPLVPERERALKPMDSFKECDCCPEMVVVPAGSFTMGSPGSEAGRSAEEGPQHTVTFAHPFAVGRFAVTFAQ
jgi:formylglycine-generating enzyme required for sulfatase activity